LVQFMAQWFRAIFFELPGHGQSQAFRQPFSTGLVAQLVEELLDKLGYERFNLMGFSFGGILAMRVIQRLRGRIDRLLLISPCLDHRALQLSAQRRRVIRGINRALTWPPARRGLYRLMHSRRTVRALAWTLSRLGRLEATIHPEEFLPRIRKTTLEVLGAQIEEILMVSLPLPQEKHRIQCYFAMSINDPLLDYHTTRRILLQHFEQVDTLELIFPYHQPPHPVKYTELQGGFRASVERFLQTKQEIGSGVG
jgi:pimeloyl-ACP methyl ester carboxylesterase